MKKIDLAEVKEWWGFRDPFYYSAEAETYAGWLIAEVERLTAENELRRRALLNVLPKLEDQNRNGINWYHDIRQIREALAEAVPA